MAPNDETVNKVVIFNYNEGNIIWQENDQVVMGSVLDDDYVDAPLNKLMYYSEMGATYVIPKDNQHIVFSTPSKEDTAPLKGRKAVYLDQNHWAAFHQAINHPETIEDKALVVAYKELLNYMFDSRIILPLSHNHILNVSLIEDAVERDELAKFIMRMSVGWQMLHPMSVLAYEYALNVNPAVALQIKFEPFSLEQHTHNPSLRHQFFNEVYDSEPEFVYKHMLAIASLVTMMLKSDYADILTPGIDVDTKDADYMATARKYADFVLGSDELIEVSGPQQYEYAEDKAKVYSDVISLIEELNKEFKRNK